MLFTQILLLPLLAAQALAQPLEQPDTYKSVRATRTTHATHAPTRSHAATRHTPTGTAASTGTARRPKKSSIPYAKKSVACSGGTKKKWEAAHFTGFSSELKRSFELKAKTCYQVACIGRTGHVILCNEGRYVTTVPAADCVKASHDLVDACFKSAPKNEGTGIVKATGNWSLTVKKSNNCVTNAMNGLTVVVGPLTDGRRL